MSKYERFAEVLPLDAPDITPSGGDTVRIDTDYHTLIGKVERYNAVTDRVTVRFFDPVWREMRTLTYDGWRVSIVLKAEAAALTVRQTVAS